jgi:hypothetical protein
MWAVLTDPPVSPTFVQHADVALADRTTVKGLVLHGARLIRMEDLLALLPLPDLRRDLGGWGTWLYDRCVYRVAVH